MRRMNVIVGEAPGRGNDPGCRIAFQGRTGRFMSKAVGPWWRDCFDAAVNLLGESQGKSGKGSEFPAAKAKIAADALVALLTQVAEKSVNVVCAGWRVACCFGKPADVDYFERWTVVETDQNGFCTPFNFYAFPHPSGVNRWWNSKANRQKAKRFMLDVMQGRLQ